MVYMTIQFYTLLTLGSATTDELVGYPYVSLVDHPGVVVIVRDKNINEIVIEMIVMIMNIYPLILLNLLMMVTAGLIVWILVRTKLTIVDESTLTCDSQ